MASDLRFSDFKRWFQSLGVTVTPGKGSHYMFSRVHGGVEYSYPIPTVSGRHVKQFYLKKTRKALKLTAEDGTPDSSFS